MSFSKLMVGVAIGVSIVLGGSGLVMVGTVRFLMMSPSGTAKVIAMVRAAQRKAYLPSAAEAAKARAERQTPVVIVAPTPLPVAFPLAGVAGLDGFGYPKQYVDQAALRSLLWHEKFADLTWYFEQYQDRFEADPKYEYWPADAADTFDSAEGALEPALDAWVNATPSSFAPYLARGTYRLAVAWAMRGWRWASETPETNLAAMHEAQERALSDLQQALSRRPKSVAALRARINALRLGGSSSTAAKRAEDERDAIRTAEDRCPSCFQVRVAFLYSLTPRWGGSYEHMNRFAEGAQNPAFPKLAALLGYAEKDRADGLAKNKQYDEAMRVIDAVCARYDHWEFLDERAQINTWRSQPNAALPDLERALQLRPGHVGVLMHRGAAYSMLSRWQDAGTDLLAALRVEPTDSLGRHHIPFVIKGLKNAGWNEFTLGRRDRALKLLDLAAELAPVDQEVQAARATVVYGATTRDPAPDTNSIIRAAAANPDDFRAVQQLDYLWSKEGGRFAEIVELWNNYLSKHPVDGRAYLERGGAYYHLGKLSQAAEDASKACELGVSEGCARAKQLGH